MSYFYNLLIINAKILILSKSQGIKPLNSSKSQGIKSIQKSRLTIKNRSLETWQMQISNDRNLFYNPIFTLPPAIIHRPGWRTPPRS